MREVARSWGLQLTVGFAVPGSACTYQNTRLLQGYLLCRVWGEGRRECKHAKSSPVTCFLVLPQWWYLQSRSISMLAWRIWLNAALPLGLVMLGNPEVITQGLGTRHKIRAAHSWEAIPGNNTMVKLLTFVTKDTGCILALAIDHIRILGNGLELARKWG